MNTNQRFSILPFPQYFDGNKLTLNIVVLPRNQNPLNSAITNNIIIPDAPPFADAKISFVAKITGSLDNFPNNQSANTTKPAIAPFPFAARQLFEALGKNFNINNFSQTNENLDSNADKRNGAVPQEVSVNKYLPETYRQAFNFTTPRTRNAVTDDRYHCAMKGGSKTPGFKRDPNDISWGKVFAFALRQPLLAKQLGMIYETSITIDVTDFPQGGWLFIDLADDSDYKIQQQADDTFLKKYAARIPVLKPGEQRQVFSSLLFPVLFKPNPADPDPAPDGNYDQLFIEAAAYDDGFAKIVHAFQPPSRNLLSESNNGDHPVKDIGIRLGWDDEQILIWYMRQMMIDTSVTNTDKRIDAPLGVFGYAIDVRAAALPEKEWETLTGVKSKLPLTLPKDMNDPGDTLSIGSFDGELPYQVYPVQPDGNKSGAYWLPMYFAHWNNHNMILPDQEAADIYQTNSADIKSDPEKPAPIPTDPDNKTGTGSTGPAQNQLNKIYNSHPTATKLLYGSQYQFRVRLRDISGGGTPLLPNVRAINESPANIAACHFKRYVAPNMPRILDLPANTDNAAEINQIKIHRPLLGYPAVVYTGKYSDPISLLKAASQNMAGKEAFGIADPDVNRIEIMVEVETLKMDYLLSDSGKDNYIKLYTTYRNFSQVNNEADYEAELAIPIIYKDCNVLHTGDDKDLVTDLQLADDIDNLIEIVLPTARTIRLTIRAVAEDKMHNEDYYGLINESDLDKDSRYGQIIQMSLYKASSDELNLFIKNSQAEELQALYLQPDAPVIFDGKTTTLLLGKAIAAYEPANVVQRLATQLNIQNHGLTITAAKGERLQLGCSNKIRHTLSPDNSSLTFSSKGDLINHWLCCIQLQLDRDWMWDALEDRSFVIKRSIHFSKDAPDEIETTEIGDIEIRHTASFDALQNANRNFTQLIFIDAVDPKNLRMQPAPQNNEPRFPDTIEISYAIETKFKPGHATERENIKELSITLPITTPPTQIPQIASAGIALSPYQRNEKYSATETRQRYLWIELVEPVRNPDDTYFARVLSYAPDQLISNNHPELFIAQTDPPLPVDPEYTRVVTSASSNDLAGLNAMQPMQKATDSDKHYLLPIPPGLHADADEMFGFFSYEFRVGHYRNKDTQEMVWCTAQGRFGRPLKATGIQHPAPVLTCTVNRDEEKLSVSAPYAVAVFNGKNMTANPPRTQLWCALYAQVKQADNKDYRNILLDNKQLHWRIPVNQDKNPDYLQLNIREERTRPNDIFLKKKNATDDYIAKSPYIQANIINKDATKYGTVVWNNTDIAQLLEIYGLPDDASLSVLVVEFLPQITNIYDHISNLNDNGVYHKLAAITQITKLPDPGTVKEHMQKRDYDDNSRQGPSPLSEELGRHRILRTSPLTEVPFVCCTTCG